MKKLIFLFFILISGSGVTAQINEIIPFEFGNPNASDLTYSFGKYFIPVIYPEEVSTLIEINSENTKYHHFNYFDFSTSPIGIINKEFFFFAKDRTQKKGLKVCKTDEGFICALNADINTGSAYNFPHYAISINNAFLVSYLFGTSGDNGYNGLALLDTSLNVLWQHDYNLDTEATYSFDLEKSNDNNILISYDYRIASAFGSYVGVSMIDLDGNIIWDKRGEERTAAGANIYHTQLSDGNIVLAYEVDKWDDSVFIENEWYRKPTRLLWLDDNGEFVKEKYILGPRTQQIIIRNVDVGSGDYFFAYGYLLGEDDIQGGLITKYSNDGDTIWSHKYQHPEFSGLGHGHFIKDIVEKEDGSIAVLCNISTPGEKQEIWLFELNENGCYGDETGCDDYLIVGKDSTMVKPPLGEKLILVPNPAQNEVELISDLSLKGAEINIYSKDGRLLQSNILQDQNIINVNHLPSGIYLIQIKSSEITITKKLVKW